MGYAHYEKGCSALHDITNLTDHCEFVKNTSDCQIDDGFINYTEFLYCTLSAIPISVACIILLIWWLFLFCGLAVTADDLCTNTWIVIRAMKMWGTHEGFYQLLSIIGCHLSESEAESQCSRVTFLAFGNGAPDIFSAIAAIGNAKEGDAGLAIGALFGAGVFVTAVVAGSIAIIRPFYSMQRPFLRDVIFYIAACFWGWYVLWDKKIEQLEAIGFIILYVFYVAVVIIGRYINQRLKNRKNAGLLSSVLEESLEGSIADRRTLDPLLKNNGPTYGSSSNDVAIEQDPVEMQHGHSRDDSDGLIKAFLQDINPIEPERWKEARIHGKFYEIFKSPLVLLLKLTVPIVGEKNEDKPDDLRNWNKLLNSVHVFTGPLLGSIVTGVGFTEIGSVFPVYGIVIIVCAILAVVVFLTSKKDKRPVYHTLFAYLGFLVAVIWIYTIANEIVNILAAVGVVFDLSDAILGLTFLAWGNSIGDLVADTTMARQGYPRMGISACFGGPLFNLLIGLGVPFTLACAKNGGTFKLKVALEEMVLAGGLAVSLVSSLIIVPLSGFYMSRPYGIFLLCLYMAFLTIAILIEVNVISNFEL